MKGVGKYSYEQTLFHKAEDALKFFREDIWKIWERPSEQKLNGALRISFKVEWATNEKAAEVNEKVIAKDTFPNDKKPKNPLREFTK